METKKLLMKPFFKNPMQGKIGWAVLWLLGIPLPVLLLAYFIRGH